MFKWLKKLFKRIKDSGGWIDEGIGIRSRPKRVKPSKESKEWML